MGIFSNAVSHGYIPDNTAPNSRILGVRSWAVLRLTVTFPRILALTRYRDEYTNDI
jgi:hypothetical protein